MKTLKCSRCKCNVEVEDDYRLKRCPKCSSEKKIPKIPKPIDVLDLNAQLKPLWSFPSYKEWKKENPEGKFADYLEQKIEFQKERKEARETHEATWESGNILDKL